MLQTFPRASRSWLHDESLLQGADAHSHVRWDRGKPFTSLSWLRSSSWLVSDRALFYNFISSIGYFISTIGNCPFYQILLLRNLQKVGHSANFGQWQPFLHDHNHNNALHCYGHHHHHCHSHHHHHHHCHSHNHHHHHKHCRCWSSQPWLICRKRRFHRRLSLLSLTLSGIIITLWPIMRDNKKSENGRKNLKIFSF